LANEFLQVSRVRSRNGVGAQPVYADNDHVLRLHRIYLLRSGRQAKREQQ
jgi:hypothetical protein